MSALKIVIDLWFIVISFFLLSSPTWAVEDLKSSNFNYFIHGQTTIEGSIGHAFFCSVLRTSPFNDHKCSGYKADGGKAVVGVFTDGGALGVVGNTMVALYDNHPTSSTYYLADLGQKVGILPVPAYAQVGGSGRNIIQPVFQIWEATRNLAYLAFTLVFIVVGLMIMLKQKINPQTVISAQQALPALVIGLILVTFSYFMAALLVDLAFISTQLIIQLLTIPGMPNSLGSNLKELADNSNVIQLFATSAFNGANAGVTFSATRDQIVNFLGGSTMGGSFARIIPAIIGAIAGLFVLGPWGAAIGGALGGIGTDVLIPTFVIIILILALMIQAFRLLFALIGCYIQILIYTLAGPLYILAGSLPGKGNLIASWIKGILANALVFPVVFGGFVLAGIILGNPNNMGSTLPMLGGLDSVFIKVLIAYGILLGLPALPGMVTKAFGVQGQPAFGQAAIGGAMAGFGLGRLTATQGWNRLSGPAERLVEARRKLETEYAAGGTTPPNPIRWPAGGVVTRVRNAYARARGLR